MFFSLSFALQILDDGAEKQMRRVIVLPAPGGPPLKLIKAVDNKMAGISVMPSPGARLLQVRHLAVSSSFLRRRENGGPDMEMSVRQPLCRRANGAFELCVWRAQDAPPITCAPHPPTAICAISHWKTLQRPATSARLSRARFERFDIIHENLLIYQNTIKLKTKKYNSIIYTV